MRRSAALLTALLFAGCGDVLGPDEEVVTLAEVSQEVQFASVDRLGPHHYIATITRDRTRQSVALVQSQETVEVRWQDWDNFEYRRTVDGSPASAVVTLGGVPWLQRGDRWRKDTDAEPYRIDLRVGWNAWDQALEGFKDRVTLVDQGSEVIEGRPARRFTVELAPAPPARGKAAKRRAQNVQPTSLSGEVWVDEATAVRLSALVQGELRRGDDLRTVSLRLSRSNIGMDQDIKSPRRRDQSAPAREE